MSSHARSSCLRWHHHHPFHTNMIGLDWVMFSCAVNSTYTHMCIRAITVLNANSSAHWFDIAAAPRFLPHFSHPLRIGPLEMVWFLLNAKSRKKIELASVQFVSLTSFFNKPENWHLLAPANHRPPPPPRTVIDSRRLRSHTTKSQI